MCTGPCRKIGKNREVNRNIIYLFVISFSWLEKVRMRINLHYFGIYEIGICKLANCAENELIR